MTTYKEFIEEEEKQLRMEIERDYKNLLSSEVINATGDWWVDYMKKSHTRLLQLVRETVKNKKFEFWNLGDGKRYGPIIVEATKQIKEQLDEALETLMSKE